MLISIRPHVDILLVVTSGQVERSNGGVHCEIKATGCVVEIGLASVLHGQLDEIRIN
jgi:hypothetical protein